MTPEEIHYQLLQAAELGYFDSCDLWDSHTDCNQVGRCSLCPADQACGFLAGKSNFSTAFTSYMLPHKPRLESNTISYYEENYPELFL